MSQIMQHHQLDIDKVYLDYNATTPLDSQVVAVITDSLTQNWHNPFSSSPSGQEAKRRINEARNSVARMINAQRTDVIFLSGGTEANNLVFHSALKRYESISRKSDEKLSLPHIIVSNIEHDSVKLVADNCVREGLAEVTEVPVGPHGAIDVADVLAAIRPNTILISVMLANNETGVVQPIVELTTQLSKLGLINCDSEVPIGQVCPLFVHTDAAQAIGKIKVDVQELQIDYLTIVGHKFYGPRIGALYAKNCLANADVVERRAPIVPLFFGAAQEQGLRPGTENTPMIIGLGVAADLVHENLKKYSNHMLAMRDYLEARLAVEFGEENLSFNGRVRDQERLPNTCNVSFIYSDQFKGYRILQHCKVLEASTGACCHSGDLRASKILLAMGLAIRTASNALRLSVGRDTSTEQIEAVIQDLKTSLNSLSLN